MNTFSIPRSHTIYYYNNLSYAPSWNKAKINDISRMDTEYEATAEWEFWIPIRRSGILELKNNDNIFHFVQIKTGNNQIHLAKLLDLWKDNNFGEDIDVDKFMRFHQREWRYYPNTSSNAGRRLRSKTPPRGYRKMLEQHKTQARPMNSGAYSNIGTQRKYDSRRNFKRTEKTTKSDKYTGTYSNKGTQSKYNSRRPQPQQQRSGGAGRRCGGTRSAHDQLSGLRPAVRPRAGGQDHAGTVARS